MANKKALLGGQHVKVENFSGFDKSRFNAFTAPLGAIVPFVKQLVLPGSFDLKVAISAQLPPLAADAFLRSHLKVEAFFVPLRQCYGGFQSFFAGEKVAHTSSSSTTLDVAKLPRLKFIGTYTDTQGVVHNYNQGVLDTLFGPHSLMDYFGVRYEILSGHIVPPSWVDPQIQGYGNSAYFNIFPFLAYQRICDEWYRNKLIERPYFSPPDDSYRLNLSDSAAFIPYFSYSLPTDFNIYLDGITHPDHELLNGSLLDLRQRNYGFDYFTTALPSAQDGSPMSVDTSAGSFTISDLRIANAAQHFAELNQLAGPDYRQMVKARYGVQPSAIVAQRPVLLGSADFSMFTSGVEQTAQGTGSASTQNPFAGIAARYGRAHAEGSDFVCKGTVDEPGYLMVMCSLVPEANYAIGVAHDMRIFTDSSPLADLPCSQLENTGYEPIWREECSLDEAGYPTRHVFGYQPRYMWHKAGAQNEVHGLFRQGASLSAFIPQRLAVGNNVFTAINSAFLKVNPDDLDGIMAVNASLSQYGVMIDSKIDLFVSEPLSESTLPSLCDPNYEHGRDVYLKRGGVGI